MTLTALRRAVRLLILGDFYFPLHTFLYHSIPSSRLITGKRIFTLEDTELAWGSPQPGPQAFLLWL